MIRIILVDDHKLFRIGLRRMLQEAHGLQIVGEAETGERAIELARELRPSIVLMDIWMPGIGGLEATRRIVRMQLDIKVIAVTACDDNPFPLQVLKAGASGYLSKGVAAEELILAIKKVFVGKRYVSSEIAQTLAMSTYEEGHTSPLIIAGERRREGGKARQGHGEEAEDGENGADVEARRQHDQTTDSWKDARPAEGREKRGLPQDRRTKDRGEIRASDGGHEEVGGAVDRSEVCVLLWQR